MRDPDRTDLMHLGKLPVQVRVWIEPTDLDPGDTSDIQEIVDCERSARDGWDVSVEAQAPSGVMGRGSLCATFVPRNAAGDRYLDVTVSEIIAEAMDNLKDELQMLAKGHGVERAKIAQKEAKQALVLIRRKGLRTEPVKNA